MKKHLLLSFALCCQLFLLSGCLFQKTLGDYNSALYDPSFARNLRRHHIQVVAPACGVDEASLCKIKQIQSIQLCFPPTFPGKTSPIFSQDDPLRLAELHQAFSNKKTTIIWSLKGGYGSARLIPYLLKQHFPHDKILIGYSDITALHLLLNRLGMQSIHGAMVNELLRADKNADNFKYLGEIFCPKTKYLVYTGIQPFNKQAHIKQETDGVLIGGNLTLISNSLGTPWQIQGENKIIAIEDVNLKGYAVDRALTQLKQAHVFDKAKAILFGNFTQSDDQLDYVLKHFAEEVKIPVYRTCFFGHGKDNLPMVFGAHCRIIQKSTYSGVTYLFEMKIPKAFKRI